MYIFIVYTHIFFIHSSVSRNLGSFHIFSSVQFSSFSLTLCDTMNCSTPDTSLSITNSWSLLKLMSIELVMPFNHLILCCPLLLPPSIFPSTRVFSNESVLRIRWLKYWSFSFSISLSSEYSGLISLKIDWLDLPAVQGTLKSLLEHHSSKASILRRSAFSIVQLSHPYMTTGKTIDLILIISRFASVLKGYTLAEWKGSFSHASPKLVNVLELCGL